MQYNNSDISCLQTLTSHFPFDIQICKPRNKGSHCFNSELGSGWRRLGDVTRNLALIELHKTELIY